MIVVSHPTGNAFVRALLEKLEGEGRLARFFTTVRFPNRREFPIQRERIGTSPFREAARLALRRFNTGLTRHESGWACLDAVYRALDRKTARWVRENAQALTWVYGYEDGSLEAFRAARDMGIRRAYELPIAYWETTRRLLREEAERWPEWEPTLGATRDSEEKMRRKTGELELADIIACPSQFVLETVPETARGRCIVAPFGSPRQAATPEKSSGGKRPLRVLFAGAMSQRKGLADLFTAMKLLRRSDVQLVVMGAPIAPMNFYRKEYDGFEYQPPRPWKAVLELMDACDVLVLPSIVEGRALVQQEAMSRGLPLIATRNAGGEDLIDDGRTGFLVPIRAPEKIAERLGQLADDRDLLAGMSERARAKADEYTWDAYSAAISRAVRP